MPDFFSRMIDRASGRVPLVRSAARPQLAPQPFAPGASVALADPPSSASAVPAGSWAEPGATARAVDAGGLPLGPAQPGSHPGDPARAAAARTLHFARSAAEAATPAPLDASAVHEGSAPSSAAVSAPEATRGVAGMDVTRASTIEPPIALDAVLARPSAPVPTVLSASPLGARGASNARPPVDLERAPDAILVRPAALAPTVLPASPRGASNARPPADLPHAPEAATPFAVAIPAAERRDPASARRPDRPGSTVLDATRPDVPRGTEHAAPSDSPAALMAPDRSEAATRAAAPAATPVMRAAPRFELREAIAAVGRALAQPPRQPTPPPPSEEVHITIGHIDVRAAAPPPPAAPARRQPSISLAEYLRRPIGSPR